MTITAHRDGRVVCSAAIELNLPARVAWGQVRDFHCYAQHDYFHQQIQIAGGVPRTGARLRLRHRFIGFTVQRIGRILYWREGEGFAFSDLSLRGPRRGFPHVFSLDLDSIGDARCIVQLRVAGRWTARWIPRLLRKLWLAWVFAFVVTRTRNELLAFQLAQRVAAK